ncbi:MAG: hypothetical protein C4K60_02525 [Ideonella sp. MAG2]|nr:MAG: hypothetical protein C4K60_02525 [Ideonella sp. MAG2]
MVDPKSRAWEGTDWQDDTASLQAGLKDAVEDDERYGEYLYFHPTLRRFIWGEQAEGQEVRTLRRWRRTQRPGKFLDVLLAQGQECPQQLVDDAPATGTAPGTLKNPPFQLRLKVKDLALYAVGQEPDLVILALHWSLDTQTKPSLAQLQDMLDCVRRTHMGYFPGESRSAVLHASGGRVPLAACWSNDDSQPTALQVDMAQLAQQKRAAFADIKARKTPLLPHWQSLLGAALANGTEQIEDERMPYMAYVRVADPTLISRADWVRLALADYRGAQNVLPYSQAFLADFEQKHCYDRFYDPSALYKTSRILNAGYAFTMVGAEEDAFFKFVAKRHFSGHYAWMGLLLQYNKAALLNFSRRLALASVMLVDGEKANDADYGGEIRNIQRELLAFTHRHWFDGFTNQIQGQEVGQQWSGLLGLPSLYAAVKNEAEMAYQLVLAEEARQQTILVKRLTVWGLLLAFIGLALALGGGAFPVDKPFSLWLEVEEGKGVCWDCVVDDQRLKHVLWAYVPFGVVVTAFAVWWSSVKVRAIARRRSKGGNS